MYTISSPAQIKSIVIFKPRYVVEYMAYRSESSGNYLSKIVQVLNCSTDFNSNSALIKSTY